MSWQVPSPVVDDRRQRNTETHEKVNTLDPLFGNACSDYKSTGTYPNGYVEILRLVEDIATK